MTKMSAKAATIMVDDSAGTPQDVSGDVISFEIDDGLEAVDVTGFKNLTHQYVGGLTGGKITLNSLWNTDATTGFTTVITGIKGSATSKTVTIYPEGSGVNYTGEFLCLGLKPGGTPGGAITVGSVEFVVFAGQSAPSWASS
jgi:hypothetical protein